MQASQGAFFPVEGNTALHAARIESMRGKFSLAPGAGKEAAFVFLSFRFDDESAFELGCKKIQE
jgi:hypothetical protein